jgi:hypothetical protein
MNPDRAFDRGPAETSKTDLPKTSTFNFIPSFSRMNKIGSSTITLVQAISLYSPLITVFSIFIFSIFSSALSKGLFYIASVFFVTAIRIAFLYFMFPGYDKSLINSNSICENGKIMPYTGKTYSTFFLTFTACYFVVPMFILTSMNSTNMINYLVLLFFIVYIIFDSSIKFSLNCITYDMSLLGDFLAGGLFGSLLALLLFYSDKISLMFINELNSNKEVCSVPSKQHFKCSILRDGQIIGSSITT